jgi:hypothetical protein
MRRIMLARRFLWIIAIIIFLVVAAAFAWRLAGNRLLAVAMVPSAAFDAAAAGPPYRYDGPAGWAARPGVGTNPADFRPAGAAAAERGDVAVFFVPPTAVFVSTAWNGRSDAPATAARLAGFVRIGASALADAGPLWAPHYRQAALGSFLADTPETRAAAQQALDLAYSDVARAFAAFLAAQPADAPIVLAGHSQGSLHLMRLLAQQVAGTKLASRVVAAYLVGWPISTTADLPALGLPACQGRNQAGCILAWQAFAEPADPQAILAAYNAGNGLAGSPRRGTPMLCTNPVEGGPNPGSLVPSASLEQAQLVAPGVPVRCDARGLLLIGPPPQGYPAYVLPGNNYHVFDYPLVWQAVRDDLAARVAAWAAAGRQRR